MLPTLLLMEQVNGKIQVSQLDGISRARDTPKGPLVLVHSLALILRPW